uniref:Uncharacterized protein n=1 Tax=Crocodylus porosus TaxID=8502 RepID=A0A7M4EPJ2_CROPO
RARRAKPLLSGLLSSPLATPMPGSLNSAACMRRFWSGHHIVTVPDQLEQGSCVLNSVCGGEE